MFTYTKMRWDDPNWVTHEIDFKDNLDKFNQILRANLTKETIKVQVKVQWKVYDLLSTDLYF